LKRSLIIGAENVVQINQLYSYRCTYIYEHFETNQRILKLINFSHFSYRESKQAIHTIHSSAALLRRQSQIIIVIIIYMFVYNSTYKTGSRQIIKSTTYYMLQRIVEVYFFFNKSFKYEYYIYNNTHKHTGACKFL